MLPLPGGRPGLAGQDEHAEGDLDGVGVAPSGDDPAPDLLAEGGRLGLGLGDGQDDVREASSQPNSRLNW